MSEGIDFCPVLYWAGAKMLAHLRNECRYYMTGSDEFITEAKQRKFLVEQIETRRVRAWLMFENGAAIGYAILRPDTDGGVWMSCGIGAADRDKGYGTMLVRFATMMGHFFYGSDVYLEVLENNHRARHVYEKLGYSIAYWMFIRHNRGTILGMVHHE